MRNAKLTTLLHAGIKRVYGQTILDGRVDAITIVRCQYALDYLIIRNDREQTNRYNPNRVDPINYFSLRMH